MAARFGDGGGGGNGSSERGGGGGGGWRKGEAALFSVSPRSALSGPRPPFQAGEGGSRGLGAALKREKMLLVSLCL